MRECVSPSDQVSNPSVAFVSHWWGDAPPKNSFIGKDVWHCMMGNAEQPSFAMVGEAPSTAGTSSRKISFSSQVESKIQKDEAQPSLFTKGPTNPKNGRRCTSHIFSKRRRLGGRVPLMMLII